MANKRVKNVIQFPKRVLSPIRDYLVNMQKSLERRRKQLDKEDPFADPSRVNDNAASDADAAEISGHDRVVALKYDVDKRLINVRKALTRIKIGKYGLCESCGKLIDTDRLAVNPTAEFCIECEKKRKK